MIVMKHVVSFTSLFHLFVVSFFPFVLPEPLGLGGQASLALWVRLSGVWAR